MNNLIQFVVRYSAFLLFALLEITAFYLVVQYNEGQQAIFRYSATALSGRVYKAADEFYRYNRLAAVSDSMARENARLKEHVFNLERSLQHYIPAGKPLDSCVLETYTLIDASVISNSSVPASTSRSAPKIERGQASFYGGKYHGRKTASGEVFDKNIPEYERIMKETMKQFADIYLKNRQFSTKDYPVPEDLLTDGE